MRTRISEVEHSEGNEEERRGAPSRIGAQRSGSDSERRSDEVSELSCLHGSEGYEVRSDEVKLIRAQGECLGIESRRRT